MSPRGMRLLHLLGHSRLSWQCFKSLLLLHMLLFQVRRSNVEPCIAQQPASHDIESISNQEIYQNIAECSMLDFFGNRRSPHRCSLHSFHSYSVDQNIIPLHSSYVLMRNITCTNDSQLLNISRNLPLRFFVFSLSRTLSDANLPATTFVYQNEICSNRSCCNIDQVI